MRYSQGFQFAFALVGIAMAHARADVIYSTLGPVTVTTTPLANR